MLNRLPSDPASFRELAKDLGLTTTDTRRIARALDVSERTVRRWWASDAPRSARLALWWLSRAGHSAWDCEMHNRTMLALEMNRSLWSTVRRLETQASRADDLRPVGRAYGPPANEPSTEQRSRS